MPPLYGHRSQTLTLQQAEELPAAEAHGPQQHKDRGDDVARLVRGAEVEREEREEAEVGGAPEVGDGVDLQAKGNRKAGHLPADRHERRDGEVVGVEDGMEHGGGGAQRGERARSAGERVLR